jgi:iron complex transport system substrate-binding protein
MKRMLLAALVLVGGLTACSSDAGTPNPPPNGSTAAAFPVTVGSLTLDKRPERIVSLSSTATEMLFGIGAGKQVVAVDMYSTYPADAPKSDLDATQPSAEAISNYRPDLVVLAYNTNQIVEQLATLKVPTLLLPAAATLDDSYGQLTDLGKLTGHPTEAADVIGRMRSDIDKLVRDVPKRSTPLTYYYELDQNYYSVGSKTFIGSLFAMVGLSNVADAAATADNQYPQLSAESIIKANPDLIFLADTKCCGQSAAAVAQRAGWGGMTAVRNHGVIALDDDIASRWGPRVVDLMRAITTAVGDAPVN